ncbi:MAG: alpha/beta fold hydrolase [Bryobacteraceae bacterium]
MRNRLRYLALLLAVAFAVWGQTASITGGWEGVLAASNGDLHLRIHIAPGANGKLAATFDSVDQGAFGIPLSGVSFVNGVLQWKVPGANASFMGVLNDAGTEISGMFEQGASVPLTLKRLSKEQEQPARPQDPKPPLPYKTEEVTFPSKAAGVKLAGTLTIPEGAGPFPAAILLPGSGPHNRDEAIFGHKTFLVLADYLTRHGIAVLRFDKRGLDAPPAEFQKITEPDLSQDAEGAFDYLKAHARIDGRSTGLIGHSEGGSIAAIVAARRQDIAFAVLLAAPGVPLPELLALQARKLGAAGGSPPDTIEANAKIQDKVFQALAGEKDAAAARAKIEKILGGGAQAEAEAAQDTSPWFRSSLAYDPAATLAKVKCPVLALDGELDLQVPATQNLPPIEAALKQGGNKDYRVTVLPKLNHLFQTAKTGAIGEYGQIDETFAPAALDEIANWIHKHAGKTAEPAASEH